MRQENIVKKPYWRSRVFDTVNGNVDSIFFKNINISREQFFPKKYLDYVACLLE